jgi:murein DD-endopeptidase MepM/ murein hydrolase activator NlpD
MKKYLAITVFIACFFIENLVYADYFVDPPYSIPYTLNGHTYDQMMQQIHTNDLVNNHSWQQVYYCNSSYFNIAKPILSAVANAYNPFSISIFTYDFQDLFSSDTGNWDYDLVMGNTSEENLDFCVVYYTSDGGTYWTQNSLGSVPFSADFYGDFTYTDFIRSTFDLYWSPQPFVPSSWLTNQFQDGQTSKANRLIIPASSFGTATELFHFPLSGSLENRTILLGFGDAWIFGECPKGVYKKHAGIDLDADIGEGVYASHSGIVKLIFTKQHTQWADAIIIENDDAQYTTVYWHVIKYNKIATGQHVTKGQRIATVANLGGNTHFHFGFRLGRYNSNFSIAGALPEKNCGTKPMYPAFPENFIDPTQLTYE